MIMAMMKNTGMLWIGQIPVDWELGKVKYAFTRKKEKSTEKDPIVLSLARAGVKIRDISTNEGQLAASYEGYNPVEPNDLLLNPMDLVSGANCSISKVSGVISPAYVNLRAKIGFEPRYYDYYFKTQYWNMGFFVHGKGVSFENRWTLNDATLKDYYIPMPSLSEQQAIADYLDETCSKIDEIIAEAKASIDEYKTLKQALIAEITTNGLNKNIDFCETNFAWMGKIPSHWELKPFKYVLNERNEKNNPIKSTERLSLSIDKGITLYAEKTTNLDRFKDDFTAYKLANKGDLVMNSMNMIVGASGVSDYFGCVSPVYYTYFDNEPDHITAKYCEYLFRSRMLMRVLRSLGRGIHHIDRGDDRVNTCRLKVSRDDLRTLVLPVPPLCEQRDIVSFLDKRTTEIDSLISEKESLINDLEAYKKSLIYEVVTGKRRVV
ncbi:MAG: restriction endonuclease subunit S [Holdemanella biformis]|nr:restriction endonuclease subunit S [Holdemanella biformis]